ncbi:FxDxF family PEP-CTERM protein [Roseateles sp. PN1]|uniref:FxDxF family PEP-CTERM protein n=1 Tax=Roseateles sp. PN1 TaxID=3137372 RepID=UPI003139E8A3
MKTLNSIKHILSAVALLSAAGQTLAADAVDFRNWGTDGSAPLLAAGGSINAVQAMAKSNYSDNPGLMFSAWAHAGGTPWYTFQLATTTDVTINLTPAVASANFAPGLTLWASGNQKFDGGSEGIETGNNGWGDPHSFNVVGQIGDFGTAWMSGANGNMLQTLAYAVTGPAHTDTDATGWGEVIKQGVNDISTDNTFEQGVTGTANGNQIHLQVKQLQAGWYTLYIGGTDNSKTAASYNLDVSAVAAVPEPASLGLMLAGMGLLALRRSRRRHEG